MVNIKRKCLILVILTVLTFLFTNPCLGQSGALSTYRVKHIFILRFSEPTQSTDQTEKQIPSRKKYTTRELQKLCLATLNLEGSFFLHAYFGNSPYKHSDPRIRVEFFPANPRFRITGPNKIDAYNCIRDADGREANTHDFNILGPGTWEESVTIPSPQFDLDTIASCRIVVNRIGEFIAGTVESEGQAAPVDRGDREWSRFSTYSFSSAVLKMIGGNSMENMEIEWQPEIIASTSGQTRGMIWDPICIQVIDSSGRVIQQESLLEITVNTKGEGKFQWNKSSKLDTANMDIDLRIRIPGRLTNNRAILNLRTQDNKVIHRKATGFLRSVKVVSAQTSRRTVQTPTSSVQVLSRFNASMPKIKLRCRLPELKKGQRYVLLLGGGGDFNGI